MSFVKRIYSKLPNDWIYQLVQLFLISAFTFYLFEFFYGIEILEDYWAKERSNMIISFLVVQGCVKVSFFWGVSLVLKKIIFKGILKRVDKEVLAPRSISDLRELSQLRSILARLFGIPRALGVITTDDIDEFIDAIDLNDEIDELIKSTARWTTVALMGALVLILVYHLSALYIIPLLIFIMILQGLFWYVMFFMIRNASLLQSFRKKLD